jgi:hypothetical protein
VISTIEARKTLASQAPAEKRQPDAISVLMHANDELTEVIARARPQDGATAANTPSCSSPTVTDFREAVSLVDSASGEFCVSMDLCADLGALFEAITAAMPEDCLARRLADMGRRLCEERHNDFDVWREQYTTETERFLAMLRISGGTCDA